MHRPLALLTLGLLAGCADRAPHTLAAATAERERPAASAPAAPAAAPDASAPAAWPVPGLRFPTALQSYGL